MIWCRPLRRARLLRLRYVGEQSFTWSQDMNRLMFQQNGEDWHLGVLRLPMSTASSDNDPEDWYFSGVYVETGSITTGVSGPSGAGGSGSGTASSSVTSAAATTMYTSMTTTGITSTSTSTPASSGSVQKYGQCGGSGWTGATACMAGSSCTVLNQYYSQCL